jgi:predicted metal-dependent phosphotriesterase family hydrolase
MTQLSHRDLRGKAQTVQGIIDPAALGPTLMHEHLLWDIRPPKMRAEPDQGPDICLSNVWKINYGSRKVPNNLVFFDRDIATAEVENTRAAGGRSLVELTVGGLKPDPDERLFRLADSGCILELDLFGQEQSLYSLDLKVDLPNDAARLRSIRRLIDRGHLEQITVSHDICYRTRLTQFGGHGYGHIFENVVPLMRRRGFSEGEIEQITLETPKRLLTFV